MKNYFSAHKFRLAYTFLILAFVVAACNYPVTQHETVGDVLIWNIAKENTLAADQINRLDWLKSGEYNYKDENTDGEEIISYSLVIPKENIDKVPEFIKQLENIAGVGGIRLIPINETVKRPVYSALLNGIFKIDINATNMSDDELRMEVETQLKNAGIENAQVDFEKDGGGKRMIRLFIPDQQLKKDGGFDMTIKDGNNVSRMKGIRKDGPGGEDKFKGKSDQEIRDMVRQDLDRDLKDDEIEIIRDGENVMVKIKKLVENKSGTLETETKLK